MERTLKVIKLSDNSFALENVFLHNEDDFNGKQEIFLESDNTIYKSLANNIEKGKLGIGMIQRNHHKFAFDDSLNVKEVFVENKILSKLVIKLSKRQRNTTTMIIHLDDFSKYLINRFKKHYFNNNQKLIFDYHEFGINGQIMGNGCGFITEDTEINIHASDIHINIIDSSIMSRDLFRNDFNFEEIGIGGLDDELANVIRRALSSRAINPSIISKLGINHVKGIILHGPPGTGKTLIARNIGKLLSNENPTIINGPEIMNKFVGQSEENLRNIFAKAKTDFKNNGQNSQLHIFIFDEIDAICKKRGSSNTQFTDSIVNQLLTIIDGVESLPNIFLIAMTNRIDLIDDALIRPGRIEIKVKIGLPDYNGRKQIFRIHTDRMKNNSMMGNIDINDLCSQTENFSGAEIESIVKNATSYAINDILISDVKDILESDIVVESKYFYKALAEIKPAFGNNNLKIKELLPDNFTFQSVDQHKYYLEMMDHIDKTKRLNTLLLYGDHKSGKSVLVSKIAVDADIRYIKMIRPIDVIRFDEKDKSLYLTDIFMDGLISESSLIILDDIEVLINFVDLGTSISFSNKLYQLLLTIMKTIPDNVKNNLTIICTTADNKLMTLINNTFDKIIKL
jgi:vesicle-fusing ATPase